MKNTKRTFLQTTAELFNGMNFYNALDKLRIQDMTYMTYSQMRANCQRLLPHQAMPVK